MKSQLGFPQGDKLSASITELIFKVQAEFTLRVSALPVESLSLSKIISTLYSQGTQCFFHVLSLLSAVMYFTV